MRRDNFTDFIKQLLNIGGEFIGVEKTTSRLIKFIDESIDLKKLYSYITANRIISLMLESASIEDVERLSQAIIRYQLEERFRNVFYIDMLLKDYKFVDRIVFFLGIDDVTKILRNQRHYIEQIKKIEMSTIEMKSCLLQRVI